MTLFRASFGAHPARIRHVTGVRSEPKSVLASVHFRIVSAMGINRGFFPHAK